MGEADYKLGAGKGEGVLAYPAKGKQRSPVPEPVPPLEIRRPFQRVVDVPLAGSQADHPGVHCLHTKGLSAFPLKAGRIGGRENPWEESVA